MRLTYMQVASNKISSPGRPHLDQARLVVGPQHPGGAGGVPVGVVCEHAEVLAPSRQERPVGGGVASRGGGGGDGGVLVEADEAESVGDGGHHRGEVEVAVGDVEGDEAA